MTARSWGTEEVSERMVELEDPGHYWMAKGTQEAESIAGASANAATWNGDGSFTGQPTRASIWYVSSSCALHDW